MNKAEINALELKAYDGPLEFVDDQRGLEKAVAELHRKKVLGFDTETRPAYRKGESYMPALLQLGDRHKVWLIDLKAGLALRPLAAILENGQIIKAGVAIGRDVDELKELFHFKPAGFVDLGDVARKAGHRKTGLRSLCAELLGFRISKQAQQTNWEKRPLTEKQQRYAATDAWAGDLLHEKFAARQAASINK